jgi:hypothetical protein
MLGSVDVGKRSVADYESTAGREAVERLRALAEPLRGARVLHLTGLVLGPVLGLAQWLALHRFVRRAALWMPTNALAWAFGMVVIFAGMDLALGGGFGPGTVPILALTLLWGGQR